MPRAYFFVSGLHGGLLRDSLAGGKRGQVVRAGKVQLAQRHTIRNAPRGDGGSCIRVVAAAAVVLTPLMNPTLAHAEVVLRQLLLPD
jgi:hypothetical protein